MIEYVDTSSHSVSTSGLTSQCHVLQADYSTCVFVAEGQYAAVDQVEGEVFDVAYLILNLCLTRVYVPLRISSWDHATRNVPPIKYSLLSIRSTIPTMKAESVECKNPGTPCTGCRPRPRKWIEQSTISPRGKYLLATISLFLYAFISVQRETFPFFPTTKLPPEHHRYGRATEYGSRRCGCRKTRRRSTTRNVVHSVVGAQPWKWWQWRHERQKCVWKGQE